MHQRVEKREQPEHAAEAGQPVPASQSTQRCNRERNHDETYGPDAETVLNFLDRVGTEPACDFKCVAYDKRRWREAQQKDDWFPYQLDLSQCIQVV